MKKNLLFYILILITIIFSLICMKDVVHLAYDVLNTVLFQLFPTLFPFMCLLTFSMHYGLFDALGHFLHPFFSFLHLSKTGLSLFLSTFFSGYPTNIHLLMMAYQENKISLHETYALLKCASFASPSFIFTSLALAYPYSLCLYIAHILPPCLYLCFCHRQLKDRRLEQRLTLPSQSFVSVLKKTFIQCMYPFIFIYGFMLVFRVLILILSHFLPAYPLSFLHGIFEFSSGTLAFLQQYPMCRLHLSIIAFFLSFSGLSVIMQCDSLLDTFPHSLSKLIQYRLLHAIASFILCFIIYPPSFLP